ncbi:MAG: hypothetical protein GY792_27825 [Gammaproteobacteria bacterium]|nr:hypothetical protein [Gammaproteobacteria bacterium]
MGNEELLELVQDQHDSAFQLILQESHEMGQGGCPSR